MSDKTYNGWTNYATWRVKLEMFDGMTARDIVSGQVPASDLKEEIRYMAEDTIEQSSTEGLARDYAFAFLSDVNWYEIAEALIEDAEYENA